MKPMRGLGFKIEAGRSDPHLRAIREGGWSSDQDGDPFDATDVQGVVKLFAPDAIFLGTMSPKLATKTEEIAAIHRFGRSCWNSAFSLRS
jgi:hypothetical protein